jgi:hypothetical protein
MRNPVIIVGEEIGQGAESRVYRVEEVQPRERNAYRHHHRHGEPRDIYHVLKVPGPQGAWQVNTLEFRLKCIEALLRAKRPHIPTTIVEQPTIILPGTKGKKDQIIQPDMAQMSPLIPNFANLNLEYDHFFNPALQEQLIGLAKDAERIAREEQIGLDPYGAEIMTDFVAGVRQKVLKIMARIGEDRAPDYVMNLIRSEITGVRGQMRNLLVGDRSMVLTGADASYYPEYGGGKSPITVLEPGIITLSDIGMHDLSDLRFDDEIQGKGVQKALNLAKIPPSRSVTIPLQYLMWGTMIKLLIQANPELAKRPDLPFTKEPTMTRQIVRDLYNKFGADFLVNFMTPEFEEALRQRKGKGNLPS